MGAHNARVRDGRGNVVMIDASRACVRHRNTEQLFRAVLELGIRF